MRKWLSRRPVESAVISFFGVSVLGLTSIAMFSRPAFRFGPDLLILAALALLTELWPVSIFRRGLRITFTLPFLVGIVVVSGPILAVAVDAAISLVAAWAMSRAVARNLGVLWIGVNVGVAALAGTLAAFAWQCSSAFRLQTDLQLFVQVAAFVLTYGISNYVLVATIDRIVHRKSIAESLMLHWRPNVMTVLLYAFAAIVVAFLAHSGYAAWSSMTILPIAVLRHSLKLQERYIDQYYDTISALSMMLQRVHPYTLGHLRRVSRVAEDVALRIGLSARRANLVKEAAILHDIGKIGINEAVLDKPGSLTAEEFDHVKQHPTFGALILEPAEAFAPMVRWIRHHHERPDGTGYPDQLTDLEIPIESKIIAVVDAFDAMTGGEEGKDQRTYRDPMTVAEALAELERCSATQFDAAVVFAFRETVMGASA
jgi:hypothetical protein